jgi:hypothetical protein
VDCGVDLRERIDCEMLESLADVIAGALQSRFDPFAAPGPERGWDLAAPAGEGASTAPRAAS